MKYLCLSDSHGDDFTLKMILQKNKYIDACICLGDMLDTIQTVLTFSSYKKYIFVKGNCDGYLCKYPFNRIEKDGETGIYITHGSAEGVKNGLYFLRERARDNKCSVALFGHTHTPFCEEVDGVLLCNPGAVTNGSYGILTVDSEKVDFENKNIV